MFIMNMHRDDLGHYRSKNTVTEFEPETSIAWAPGLDRSYPCKVVDMLANIREGGHTYTYRLREVDGGTEVTQIYDWSGVTDPQFEGFRPFVSREELAGSLANLARAAEALVPAVEPVVGYVIIHLVGDRGVCSATNAVDHVLRERVDASPSRAADEISASPACRVPERGHGA